MHLVNTYLIQIIRPNLLGESLKICGIKINTKYQLSRTRLRRQIAQCNAIINKQKAEYYSTVISGKSHDPEKLWQVL